MPHALVDVEITEALPELELDGHHDGVGLVSRRRGHVVGFALHDLPGPIKLAADRVAALLDPDPGVEVIADAGVASTGPTITVAVCTRDRPELLRDCLASLSSTGAAPLEVLVVDNAPADARTFEVATAAGARYVVEPCPGPSFARNRALACARGEVVLFVDDDVVVDRHWFDALCDVWRRTPTAGAATGQVLPYELETDAQVACERRGGFRGGNHRLLHALPGPVGDRIFPYGASQFGTGANMAVRRDLALQLGGFDEAFGAGPALPGGEDIDMMHRVVRHGHPLVYEPRAVVFHRHRRHQVDLDRQYRSWGQALMAFVVKTYAVDPPGRAQLRRLMRWFFVTHARAALVGALRRDREQWRAEVEELVGGFTGLLGVHGRSRRRSARLRARWPMAEVIERP